MGQILENARGVIPILMSDIQEDVKMEELEVGGQHENNLIMWNKYHQFQSTPPPWFY